MLEVFPGWSFPGWASSKERGLLYIRSIRWGMVMEGSDPLPHRLSWLHFSCLWSYPPIKLLASWGAGYGIHSFHWSIVAVSPIFTIYQSNILYTAYLNGVSFFPMASLKRTVSYKIFLFRFPGLKLQVFHPLLCEYRSCIKLLKAANGYFSEEILHRKKYGTALLNRYTGRWREYNE